MNDLSTLSFSLTHAGTLGVALLIFLGQALVFSTLLLLAGSLNLLAWTAVASSRDDAGRRNTQPARGPRTPTSPRVRETRQLSTGS